MYAFASFHRCLLAMALVLVHSIAVISAHAYRAGGSDPMGHICTASGIIPTPSDAPGDPASPAGHHAGQCSLCDTSPALTADFAPTAVTESAPTGALKVGASWYLPTAVAAIPPPTGPPQAI